MRACCASYYVRPPREKRTHARPKEKGEEHHTEEEHITNQKALGNLPYHPLYYPAVGHRSALIRLPRRGGKVRWGALGSGYLGPWTLELWALGGLGPRCGGKVKRGWGWVAEVRSTRAAKSHLGPRSQFSERAFGHVLRVRGQCGCHRRPALGTEGSCKRSHQDHCPGGCGGHSKTP